MKQYTKSIRGKLFNYFKGKLHIKQSTKGWWRSDCFECGGKFSMGIHLEERRAHCFKCAMRKTPIEILMEMEGFTTIAQATQYLNIQQEYEYYESYARTGKREIKPVELPESFNILSQGNGTYGRAARHYITKRGFHVDKLSLKGVGYCTSGEYAGYIIFPFYCKGKLIYFQGRHYIGMGPKMKNPSTEAFGIGKEQIIYNQDALYIYNHIYTVESITNAETLGDRAIATLGKSISQYQLSHLIASPCKSVTLLLDPDAYKEAIETAMQIVNFKKARVIKLPDEKMDVNDYGKDKTLEFVKTTQYQNYNELFRLKLNINGNFKRPEHTYQRVGPNRVDRRGV
jgi:DNA primase